MFIGFGDPFYECAIYSEYDKTHKKTQEYRNGKWRNNDTEKICPGKSGKKPGGEYAHPNNFIAVTVNFSVNEYFFFCGGKPP